MTASPGRASAPTAAEQTAEKILQAIDTSSEIDYKPLPVDDPRVRQPDISLAREILGWEPKVEFEEGIADTIAYFRKFLGLDA